ncbi:MAG: hypothetical protein QMD09_12745, partial [Desulfatibacillaceae bacterium]|nr:hypothetical protein [Desulfatibacillaceae bacterium]
MSNGEPGDWENTQAQLKNPNPIIGDKTWLQHKKGNQTFEIDLMLLKGSTMDEMVDKIAPMSKDKNKPRRAVEARIMDHIEHLQKGDAKGNAKGMRPHYLKVEQKKG